MTTNVVMLGDGKRPMTAREFRAALKELEKSIGPRAQVDATIGEYSSAKDDPPIKVAIYIHYGNCTPIYLMAETLEEAVEHAHEVWVKRRDEMRADVIQRMALKIIKITDDSGTCSDAALRQAWFSDADIKELGEQACARAAEMGGRAPFAIVSLGKSNAA